ncbi:hypothetical protein [Burkholderia cepacia]|uniref:hypothetical protein n=1 Tax=Burkholderia cepacia TaxID=292 RepID=UPI0007C82A1E|nr:hypothetical protein [Burkholderia cepacia]
MAKRDLSSDYRLGISRAHTLLIRWEERCRDNWSANLRFPEELRYELAQTTGEVRMGMEDCFAACVRAVIERNLPILKNWKPIEELEEPAEFLYGVGVP